MNKVRLKCACCGAFAGYWEQHPNQDTGWGMCKGCAAWIKEKGMSDEEFKFTYGEAGVNYEGEEPK